MQFNTSRDQIGVRFSKQIMSTNKCPSIFSRKMEAFVYICSLYSADEFQDGRNSCPMLRSCFIGSFHVVFFHVVSALQTIVCLYRFFGLIRSLVDPMLAAFIVCGPLQFLVSQHWRAFDSCFE